MASYASYETPPEATPVVPRLPSVFFGPDPAGGAGPAPLTLALLAVLAVVLLYCVWVWARGAAPPRDTAPAPAPAPLRDTALAQGVAARGWTLYLLRGCGYCDRQVRLLGEYRAHVLYGPDGALLGGYTKAPPLAFGAIGGFPHWHNPRTGEARAGLQDAAALRQMDQK